MALRNTGYLSVKICFDDSETYNLYPFDVCSNGSYYGNAIGYGWSTKCNQLLKVVNSFPLRLEKKIKLLCQDRAEIKRDNIYQYSYMPKVNCRPKLCPAYKKHETQAEYDACIYCTAYDDYIKQYGPKQEYMLTQTMHGFRDVKEFIDEKFYDNMFDVDKNEPVKKLQESILLEDKCTYLHLCAQNNYNKYRYNTLKTKDKLIRDQKKYMELMNKFPNNTKIKHIYDEIAYQLSLHDCPSKLNELSEINHQIICENKQIKLQNNKLRNENTIFRQKIIDLDERLKKIEQLILTKSEKELFGSITKMESSDEPEIIEKP